MQAKHSIPPYSLILFTFVGLVLPQFLQFDAIETGVVVSIDHEPSDEVAKNVPSTAFQNAKTQENQILQSSQWVFKLSPKSNSSQIAQTLDAKLIRRLKGSLKNYVILDIPVSRDSHAIQNLISTLPGVLWHEQQVKRYRYSKNHPEPTGITDPLFTHQWHLYNDHSNGVDLNISSLWEDGYKGEGIDIAVVDDGLEYTHPDLSANYSSALSYDFQDRDSDPAPVFGTQFHGTAVGGLIGARDNGNYGVGIAPRATLAGYRILGGSISDYQEAEAMSLHNDVIEIYNNSWGPSDEDARYYSGPGPLYIEALQNAVQAGRQGLGNIYVWAGGNGGENEDNSNYDGYANLPWTIAVTGINEDGSKPSYSEPGSNLFVSAPGVSIVTTDLMGVRGDAQRDYVTDFGGTSAATGMVSGAIALILQKNPHLSWRDVQHVIALTARQNDPTNSGWNYNGVGIPVHHNFGFGLIDTTAAADLAESWIAMPDSSVVTLHQTLNQTLQNLPSATLSSNLFSSRDERVEHVQLTLTLQNYDWGELNVTLTSPDGTESILATPYSSGLGPESSTSNTTWTYMTVHNWGESAQGNWNLTIQNENQGHTGKVVSWELTLHTTDDPNKQLPSSLNPNGEVWETSNLSNSPQSINVLHNDSDPDWSLLRISTPVNGSATFTPEGIINYQPSSNYTGLDLINYTVTDSTGKEGRAQLQINVVSNQSNVPETVLSSGGQQQTFTLSPSSGEHVLLSQPTEGHAEILNNNTLVYQSNSGSFSEVSLHTQYTEDSIHYTTQTYTILNSPTGELSRSLNGGSDQLQLYPSWVSFDISNSITLEAWIYPESYGTYESGGLEMGYGRVFEKEVLTLFLCNDSPITPSGSPYYQDHSLALWMENQNSEIRYISTPQNSIQLNTWQHVALTISAQGVVKLYINGQEQALYSPGASSGQGTLATNSQYQFLAGNNSGGNRGFEGKMDHLRYFGKEKTAEEIAQFYQFPTTGEETGLVNFWSLDDAASPVTSSSKHLDPEYTGTSATSPYLWQPLYLTDAKPIAPDWWVSEKLGVFNTSKAPWLWSADHDYLFLSSDITDSQPLWFYDTKLEWFWTDMENYPWIWSNHQQTWLYYHSNTHNTRSFYNNSTQDWTTDIDLSNQSPKFPSD